MKPESLFVKAAFKYDAFLIRARHSPGTHLPSRVCDEMENGIHPRQSRVIKKELPDSAKETLLVLDATTGQNAVMQAKKFKEAAEITGLILTKLDGTAKGGAVFSIKDEIDLPVKFIGVGEQIDDMQPFDAKMFVEALMDEEENGEENDD